MTPGESFWVGGAARAVAAVATCPITVVKTQMEYAGYSVKHTVSTAAASGACGTGLGLGRVEHGAGSAHPGLWLPCNKSRHDVPQWS